MKIDKFTRKKLRIRSKLRKSNTNNRLRLSVARSSKNISAQIIDDVNNKTLVSASSIEKFIRENKKSKKSDLSLLVAETLAKRANEKNIKKVYLDRGGYKYHGRVKLLTETLRKHGLEF